MAKTVKSQRKFSRGKRKAAGRITPISAYVRNKISAAEYFKLTNQGFKS
jgi:hypothetical protein